MSLAIKYALGFCLVMMALLQMGPADAQVVINELMADPLSDWDGDGLANYRDDEWLEVINLGPEEVNLAGYFIRDITGQTNHLGLSGMLAPGQVQVFFGSQAVAWQQANLVPVSGLSLNNTGDTIELVQRSGEVFLVLDTVTFSDHEAEDDRSSGRDPQSGQWMLYDGLNPHSGQQEPPGTGCLPTPGQANDCNPTVAGQITAWDKVKTLYR